MNSLIRLKKTTPLFLIALVSFGLLPNGRATDTDGALPFGNNADGIRVLTSLTSGVWNSGFGFEALNQDTDGYNNTAMGVRALFSDTIGYNNTAIGVNALYSNTTGSGNTATGFGALFRNTTGGGNTAYGDGALYSNTTGNGNTALGSIAGVNVTTANNVIAIGSNVSGENVSNTCYIGNIFGVTSAGATAVYVNSLGKLGTVVSSRRFKDEIKPMDKASEAILSLRPVTFHYKTDTTGTAQFGLIAEEVAKVSPALVLPDKEGKPYTVRYDQVNAMLLNEFLKARRQIDAQQKQIEALTAGLQKVSAQLELSKAAPQTALNDQ